MATPNQNITDRLGDDLYQEVAITDTDTAAALDLTGATVEAFFLQGGTPSFSLESGDGLAVTNATGGVVQLQITRAIKTSKAISAGSYEWYLKVLSGGNEQTVLSGKYTVEASVGSIS